MLPLCCHGGHPRVQDSPGASCPPPPAVAGSCSHAGSGMRELKQLKANPARSSCEFRSDPWTEPDHCGGAREGSGAWGRWVDGRSQALPGNSLVLISQRCDSLHPLEGESPALSASLCPLLQSEGPRVSPGSCVLAWFCSGAGVAAAWHHLGEQPRQKAPRIFF